MIYGVEQNTDLRCPNTKIVKFTSIKKAKEWRDKNLGYAFPGAANEDLPVTQQNWHHRIRTIYEMPYGWRFPSKQYLREKANRNSSPTYPSHPNDIAATIIWRDGDEL